MWICGFVGVWGRTFYERGLMTVNMPMEKKKGALFGASVHVERVFGMGRKEELASFLDLYPRTIEAENIEEHALELADCEVIFATWGMFAPKAELLDRMSALRAVFYAAGTVQQFARPFLDRDILVTSAWDANAVPVAEFTLAQIILSLKRFFYKRDCCRTPAERERMKGFNA